MGVRCPRCELDLNDDAPACPGCAFHIRDLDAELGAPPARAGDVVDVPGVLAPAERAALEARLARLRAATGRELVLAVVPTSAPRKPSEHVFWLFNRWAVGGGAGEGVLVLCALAERRLECEVGCALEDVVTDAASGEILRERAAPLLTRGELGAGLLAGCDALAALIEAARGRAEGDA